MENRLPTVFIFIYDHLHVCTVACAETVIL